MKVQVAFSHKTQAWSHHFEVECGALVLDLKKQMAAEAPEEASWFELQKQGRRVSDCEPLADGDAFRFAYLGPEEGPPLAALDLERAVASAKIAKAEKATEAS